MISILSEHLSDNPTVKSLVFGTVVFTCLASVAGFAGRLWWVLDLASHFRVQYVLVLSVLCLILVLIRHGRFAVLSSVFALLNLMLVLPLFWGSARSSSSSSSTARAMMMNVNTSNTNYSIALAVIKSYAPDFLFVEEVDRRWMAELQQLDVEYPYSISRPREDNFGIAFYSKRPFVTSDILDVGQAGTPSVLVRFELEGLDFFILGTHTLPPVNAAYARFRDIHLAEIPEVVKSLDRPLLLLGDLNATRWSHSFRRLIRDSGLSDGARGRGYQPTWPAGMLPLLIPIDHCLHSPGIQILNMQIGPAVGSDHYPVIVDFSLRVGDGTVSYRLTLAARGRSGAELRLRSRAAA